MQARRGSAALRELAEVSREAKIESLPVATELEWDSPLTLESILKYPHPKLRAPNARIGVFGEPLQRLANEMFDVMYRDDGVGLAAPQVGVNLRLMVFNAAGERGKGEEMVLANPRIVSSSKRSDTLEEGCLSLRLGETVINGDVTRPVQIKIAAQDVTGARVRLTLEGFEARVFQHEFDHLDGVLFHDRFAPPTLEANRAKLLEMEEAYLAAHPGSDVRRIAPAAA